tara:strand:+ start:527 stop:877 length:351 start_codon:yes stop_codon:yes gene_type:complete
MKDLKHFINENQELINEGKMIDFFKQLLQIPLDVIIKHYIIGSDKPAMAVLKKIRENPEAMEAISKTKSLRKTVKKFISEKEYEIIFDVTRKNLETGQLSIRQLGNRNYFGKHKSL